MKKIFSARLWTILTTVFASLLAVLIIGTDVAYSYASMINVTLRLETSETVETDPNVDPEADEYQYFKADYKTRDEIKDYASEVSREIEAEGLVLLKNNGALPLDAKSKVSLFGTGSAYLNCSAQGMRNTNDKNDFPTLKAACESSELIVNPSLWAFYTTGAAKSYGGTKKMNDETGLQTYYINEAPWSLYDSTLRGTFSEYGDAAIVVITRDSTEGSDVNTTYSDGANGDYLALSTEERELLVELSNLKARGTFGKIIVLLNSAVHVQLDYIDDSSIIVDACMWIGNTGMSGAYAVADALVGKVNPSGKMPDTLVKDNFSSPAMASLSYNEYKKFSRSWDNAALNATNNKYGVYVESIYVGYRYYETRYTDLVEARKNVGLFDYDAVVAYPFGYGLSYTTFEYSNFKVEANADGKTYDVSVTVTNTGNVAGKETVQVYLQKPYTEYAQSVQMEVAAVELVGYGKTDILAPDGGNETVKISVEKENLASYDVYGAGTYILDAGKYYLTAAYNAHDAANNILAKKGYSDGMIGEGNPALVSDNFITVTAVDTETYSVSSESGNKIENQLGEMDIMRYSGMGGNYVSYVSRSDWDGTFPKAVADIALTDEMIADLQNVDINDVKSEGDMPKFGSTDGDALTLVMMRGKDYEDPDWEKLLNQLSFDDINQLMTTAICQTAAIASVIKPQTREQDGPTYCKESNNYEVKMNTRFPCEGIWAASFNDKVIAKVAAAIANETVYGDDDFLRYTGMYAPGLNIHRLNHGGRNHEYFSEDPYLVGVAGQVVIENFQKYGVIAFPKHYVFNDQEINRNGIGVWLNEQAAREIYLKPWKYALSPKRGNSHAIMTAFNRAGTKWASASKALIDIARDEFGFDGFVLTDMADSNGATYMTTLDGILAGTDAWLSSGSDHSFDRYKNNATVVNMMRESAHRIMYVTANYSAAMNGVTPTTKIIIHMVWWEIVLIVALVVFSLSVAGSIAMLVLSLLRDKKQKAA